jgi:hypothetical protein
MYVYYNVKIRLGKCNFAKNSINCLGKELTDRGVKIFTDCGQAFLSMRKPKTKEGAIQFSAGLKVSEHVYFSKCDYFRAVK